LHAIGTVVASAADSAAAVVAALLFAAQRLAAASVTESLDTDFVVGAEAADSTATVVAAFLAITFRDAAAALAFALDAVLSVGTTATGTATAVVATFGKVTIGCAGVFYALTRLTDRFTETVAAGTAATVIAALDAIAARVAGTFVGRGPHPENEVAGNTDGLRKDPLVGVAVAVSRGIDYVHDIGTGSRGLVVECPDLLATAHAEHWDLTALVCAPLRLEVGSLGLEADGYSEVTGVEGRRVAIGIALVEFVLHAGVAG
jgi:hypothetical protein